MIASISIYIYIYKSINKYSTAELWKNKILEVDIFGRSCLTNI